jgi:hypothetical protein
VPEKTPCFVSPAPPMPTRAAEVRVWECTKVTRFSTCASLPIVLGFPTSESVGRRAVAAVLLLAIVEQDATQGRTSLEGTAAAAARP